MRKALWGGVPAALALLFLVVTLSACGGLPEDAAAEVNGVVITKAEVDKRIEDLRKTYGSMIPQQDGDGDGEDDCEYTNFRLDTTEQLVQEELERQEAGARDISVSDAEIDETIQATADDGFLGDVDRLMQSYYDRGFSEEELRDDIQRTILHDKLMDDVTGEVEVSDSDIQDYYERNIDQYRQPERRTVRQLVTADLASAQAAAARARAGEDFIALVRELSIDEESKDMLGSLGLVKAGDLAPELDELAFSLETLAISDPVQVGDRWYVLKVETVIPPIDIPLEQEKENIRVFAGNEEAADIWRDFVASVYEEASIEYNSNYEPELKDEDCQRQ